MSDPHAKAEHLLDLAGIACDDVPSDDELAELDALLLGDEPSRRRYLDYCRIHVALRLQLRAHRATQRAQQQIHVQSPCHDPDSALLGVPQSHSSSRFPVVFHGMADYALSGWPVAYLVATLMTAVGLLVCSHTYISRPVQVGKETRSETESSVMPADNSKMPIVGRITGMADCKWLAASENKLPSPACGRGAGGEGGLNKSIALHSPIRLGNRFGIRSGLLEITYDTGAKVILQGPVEYEVESAAGGYLAVGKVTARMEKAAHESSSIPHSTLSTLHAPLFTIKTPSAIVTDLGTEFGVEVDKEGRTTSHVFRGVIEVRMASSNGKADAQVLHANESVRVEGNGEARRMVVVRSASPSGFVREVPRSSPKTLDLVDIVAGGDGFSGLRNRGIDPTNGRPLDTHSQEPRLIDDGKYHRVTALTMIDGVFVPDGRKGPVQLDSAGHVFDAFPSTSYEATGYIWAGGIIPLNDPAKPNIHAIVTKLGDVDYASPGHGLLFMHANKGITFDLNAMRKKYPKYKLACFHSAAGDTETTGATLADLWVFVDGQSRWQRRQINSSHGAFVINMPLEENARFLTLVATDGGDEIQSDWTLFGDPRIELEAR